MRLSVLLFICFTLLIPQAQAATFKIATIAPDGTTWMKELRKAADEIKADTEGRVKFRFYPGGVMGNDKSVLRKIRAGQLHGGAVTGGGLAAIYGDAQVYSLPLAFRSYDEVDYVRSRMDQTIIEGIYQNGYKSFGLGEGGFAYLMSGTPIKTVNDMQGQKIWTPEGDEISNAIFEGLGVSPIPLPLTDVLTALQTGMIDTITSSSMGVIALQWHTRIKYLTDTPLVYLYGTLIVKRKIFERLSKADQEIVNKVMDKTFAKLNQLNREDNNKAHAALKDQGIKFLNPTEEEKNTWRDSVLDTVDHMKNKGVVSTQIADTLYQHLNDYRNGAN